MSDKLEIFKRYVDESIKDIVYFTDRIQIKSNSSTVFFIDSQSQLVCAFYSKEFYVTIEITKNPEIIKELDVISEIVSDYRKEKGIEIKKYSFWTPHCLVNGNIVESRFICESFGIDKDKALLFLVKNDNIFREMYDKKRGYMGLPLFDSWEDAENYELKENKYYIKYLKKLIKLEKMNKGG